MILRPTLSTRTDTLFPYQTLFLSRIQAEFQSLHVIIMGHDDANARKTHQDRSACHCLSAATSGLNSMSGRSCASLRSAGRFSSHHLLARSEEHTSELQSLMRISYAVFCLKKKNHYYKKLKMSYDVQNNYYMK